MLLDGVRKEHQPMLLLANCYCMSDQCPVVTSRMLKVKLTNRWLIFAVKMCTFYMQFMQNSPIWSGTGDAWVRTCRNAEECTLSDKSIFLFKDHVLNFIITSVCIYIYVTKMDYERECTELKCQVWWHCPRISFLSHAVSSPAISRL